MGTGPFDEKIEELARRVVISAIDTDVMVGTAESCTGGLVVAALTQIAGSSAAVRGGVVSYDAAVKHDVLKVPQSIIDDPSVGVVSSECARKMCQGACLVLGCDVAVSITGIAGPGGAEPGKPVGTVWFGLATENGARTELRQFSGDRNEVRLKAVARALELLCEGIEELSNDR